MKKPVKIVLSGMGILVLAVVVAVVVILNLNPNRYKDYIAGKVSQQMDRAFEIQGDLKIGYYPWLHIETSGVFLANAPGFGELPMLSADYVRVRVKTLPLLRKQLEVDTIVLKGVRVNLAKNRDGIANWEDPGARPEKQPSKAPVEKDKGFDLANLAVLLQGGLDIQDAAFRFDDQAAKEIYTISDLNITTGRVVPGDPVDLDLSFNAEAVPPEMSGNAALKGKIFYDFNTGQYQIKPLTFQAQLAGAPLGKTTADLILNCLVDLDLVKDRVSITDLLASGLDTTVTGAVSLEGLGSGQPRVDMNLDVSGKDLALLFKVLEGGPLSAQLAGLPDRAFDLKTTVVADNARGSVSVPQFEANLLGAAISGTVQAEGIQTNLPSFKGNVTAKGPDLPMLIQVAGQMTGKQSRLTGVGKRLSGHGKKNFHMDTRFDVDLKTGRMDLPQMSFQALGITVDADLKGENIFSGQPAVKTRLKAGGPDLPLLLELAGLLRADNDVLTDLGRQLAKIPEKGFRADVSVDMAQGHLKVPNLEMTALGIALKADVTARDLGSAKADMEGQAALAGKKMSPLLAALDQPDLAALLDTVDVTARFRGNFEDLVIDPLQAKVGLSGKQIPNPPVFVTLDAPMQLQLEKDVLDLAAFSLKGLDLDLSGSLTARQIRTSPEYGGHLSVARFNLRDLMKKLNQPLPETSDKQVFEKVAMKTDFSGSASHIRLTHLAAVLDDTQMTANLAIQGFSAPDIIVDLAIDRINADRYLPPGEKPGAGRKQTARPVTPETAAAGAAVQIPVALLRSLKLNAALAIDDLIVSGAVLSRVRVNVTAKDGILTKAPLSANLYQGTYTGKVVLDATGDIPELAMDTALKGVEVEPLLMDMTGNNPIRGNGDITAALTTRGLDVDAMKQNLNGNLSFSFKNGAVKGFNVGKFLRSLKSLRESRTFAVSEQEETDFTELTGNPVVKNGVVFLDDLSGKSPALRVSGKGIVADIVRQTIDYQAIVTVVETSRGQAGSDLAELAGVKVPISVKGPLADPVITPDIRGVITSIITDTSPETVDQLKKSVEKEVGRFLKKLTD
jgi:AsmA protein